MNPIFGEYLKLVRNQRNLTLREVEHYTDGAVSNAYLSQIENGKVYQPSPSILNALSKVYDIDFYDMMKMCGHIADNTRPNPFDDLYLTEEEEEILLSFLNYLRKIDVAPDSPKG